MEDEITSIINGIKDINFFTIFILILNIGMIIISIISYIKVISLERIRKNVK